MLRCLLRAIKGYCQERQQPIQGQEHSRVSCACPFQNSRINLRGCLLIALCRGNEAHDHLARE